MADATPMEVIVLIGIALLIVFSLYKPVRTLLVTYQRPALGSPQ